MDAILCFRALCENFIFGEINSRGGKCVKILHFHYVKDKLDVMIDGKKMILVDNEYLVDEWLVQGEELASLTYKLNSNHSKLKTNPRNN